jgi:hypothetical protein
LVVIGDAAGTDYFGISAGVDGTTCGICVITFEVDTSSVVIEVAGDIASADLRRHKNIAAWFNEDSTAGTCSIIEEFS